MKQQKPYSKLTALQRTVVKLIVRGSVRFAYSAWYELRMLNSATSSFDLGKLSTTEHKHGSLIR